MLKAPWPSSDKGTTAKDSERARRLRLFAKSQGWICSQSPKRHAGAFAVLRRRLGNDEGRIDDVLAFVERTKLTKPKLTDGRELIDRWNWVEALMAKDARDNVPISANGKYVHGEVKHLAWPPGHKDKLLQTCQTTFDNWRDMVGRAKAKYAEVEGKTERWTEKRNGKVRHIVRSNADAVRYRLFLQEVANVTHNAVRYMRWLSDRLSTWNGPAGLAWQHDSTLGRQFVSQVTGRQDSRTILEELYDDG